MYVQLSFQGNLSHCRPLVIQGVYATQLDVHLYTVLGHDVKSSKSLSYVLCMRSYLTPISNSNSAGNEFQNPVLVGWPRWLAVTLRFIIPPNWTKLRNAYMTTQNDILTAKVKYRTLPGVWKLLPVLQMLVYGPHVDNHAIRKTSSPTTSSTPP